MNSIVLDDSYDKETQPEHIKVPLKVHQLTLLKKSRELEDSSINPIKLTNIQNNSTSEIKSKFGIIGDTVGSGKTLTILALISKQNVLENRLPNLIHKGLVTCTELSLTECNVKPYNIIVIPHIIYKQWKETIENYTDLTYYGINTNKALDKFKDYFITEEKSKTFDAKIILITNTRFNDFIRLDLPYWKSHSQFSRYIFDEADMLKITNSHYIKASFIWFVSSSYNTLLNPYVKIIWKNEHGDISYYYNYNEGYTIRFKESGLTHSGYIKSTMINIIEFPNAYKKHLILRNSDEFIKTAFDLPDYKELIINCKMPHYLQILNKNVSQQIINHINAGDLKGAIEKVDCEKYSENDLIKGVTKDLEIKLKNLMIEIEMKSKMTYSSKKTKEESIKNMCQKIDNIKSKISSIQEKLNSSNICSICYDEVSNTTISPCCNTKYCFGCISTWLHQKKQCPFCRASIDFNSLIIETNEPQQIKVKDELLSKLTNLKNIIENKMTNPKFKMLIFSEYYNSFTDIEAYLLSQNIKYSYVNGTTNTTNKTIRLFKDYESPDKIDVLLLNANHCANGINLENSTDIVLYHSMNKDRTTQIIGRGQRPGRISQLNVWKLCYDNELDIF
jgi:hypothetical protein